jgi:hypothetical protein
MGHVRRALMNQAGFMTTREPPEKPSLVDLHLAAEIRLLGEVIATAGTHSGPLTEAELDAVLRLADTPQQAPDDEGPPCAYRCTASPPPPPTDPHGGTSEGSGTSTTA